MKLLRWLRRPRCFVFTCPHCGDPLATTAQDSVDVHAGATYRCAECDGGVVFEALTPDEYVRVLAAMKADA